MFKIIIQQKELRNIYKEFSPHCKTFVRFLKEERYFKKFFKKINEENIPEWLKSDTLVRVTEINVLMDIMFRTIDIDSDPYIIQTDSRWIKHEVKLHTNNPDKFRNEINTFIEIVKEHGITIK